jgi:hypothetical protein
MNVPFKRRTICCCTYAKKDAMRFGVVEWFSYYLGKTLNLSEFCMENRNKAFSH